MTIGAPQIAFFAGLALFFGAHFFTIIRKRGADGVAARMGKAYRGIYSLVSLVGFALLAWGFAAGRPWPDVWFPPTWTRHLILSVMPIAMILLAAAYAPTGYIKRTVKHPMLAAVKVWAAAHLAANGDLGTIILAGSFLVYAVVDRIALKKRGDNGPADKPNILGDMIAISIGITAYVATAFWLHRLLIGVSVVS